MRGASRPAEDHTVRRRSADASASAVTSCAGGPPESSSAEGRGRLRPSGSSATLAALSALTPAPCAAGDGASRRGVGKKRAAVTAATWPTMHSSMAAGGRRGISAAVKRPSPAHAGKSGGLE